ncbi:MAG: XrtB/PEP-CTERM-associated polysaccharide biosynthesis outer membrane protein EpsL [Burkholderiales bacterium]
MGISIKRPDALASVAQNQKFERMFVPVNQRSMRRRCVIAACALGAATAIHPARADEYDTLNVTLSTSLTYDSNLFRLSESADPQATLGTTTKSDQISVSTLLLRLDKSLSQQRFQLDVSETVYRYKNFSFLDFEAFEYRGAWLWHLTPRISGTLGADRRQALVPFGDVKTAQQDLRTADREYLTLDAQLTGGWHALAGASHFQQKDSQVAISPEQSYDAVSSEAGIKYLASPGSAIAVIQRYVKGTYKNSFDPATLFDDGFHDNQSEIVADWAATGKSALRGRLTWIDRHHDNFAQRNYDGLAGEISWLWSPTAKSRFNLLGRRDITTWWDQLSSYRVSDLASASWTWQLASHTALLVQFDHVHRDYRGPVVVPTGPLRVDNERAAQIGLSWTPRRSLLLKAGVQNYSRSSNIPGNDYDGHIANISGAFTF